MVILLVIFTINMGSIAEKKIIDRMVFYNTDIFIHYWIISDAQIG